MVGIKPIELRQAPWQRYIRSMPKYEDRIDITVGQAENLPLTLRHIDETIDGPVRLDLKLDRPLTARDVDAFWSYGARIVSLNLSNHTRQGQPDYALPAMIQGLPGLRELSS